VRIQETTADVVSIRNASTAEGTVCTLTGWGSDIWVRTNTSYFSMLNIVFKHNAALDNHIYIFFIMRCLVTAPNSVHSSASILAGWRISHI
jgi:hypothetical protein